MLFLFGAVKTEALIKNAGKEQYIVLKHKNNTILARYSMDMMGKLQYGYRLNLSFFHKIQKILYIYDGL